MITQECFSEALVDGAREVFETMLFMTVEQENELYASIEGQSLLGSITFKGPLEGVMTICCDMECSKMIAVNMLGLEPGEEISDEEVQDAIGEVTNMVMGSLKSRIMESVGDVQVSIPTVISGTELDSSLGEGTETIDLIVNIDDNIARLGLQYRKAG